MSLRKLFNILLILCLLCNLCPDIFAQYSLIQDFLCELGQRYYLQGRYDLALDEFKKALLLNPNLKIAEEFIEKIQREKASLLEIPLIPILPEEEKVVLPREEIIKRALEELEVLPKIPPPPEVKIPPPEVKIPTPPIVLETIVLDERILATQPETKLEIELTKSIIISGEAISHWLITKENIISVERVSLSEIRVTGDNFGITHLHIWDKQRRWMFLVQTIPLKPIGPTLEEELRLAEEKAATFKLRYSLDWYLYRQGRRIETLKRTSYSYFHFLRLDGPTPYGNLDSVINVRRLKTSTDLTYLTLGLKDGRFGPFENFHLRGFDYSLGFSNLSFGGATLRGILLESPAFDERLNYSVFWGREGGGRYGRLSPGLPKIKDSFLSGLNLDYRPSKRAKYSFSIIRGWGKDRADYLNEYSYDLKMDWRLNNFDFGYEMGFDSESFGHLLSTTFRIPKLKLTTEFRDIDKNFLSITGFGWRRGEIGGLFTLSLAPTRDFRISSKLDIFRDRLYPAPENPQRYNTDFNFDISWSLNPLTSLRFDYSISNQLGRISQYRSQTQGIGISRTFDWIRRVNTYLSYRHTESKHFGSPFLDYINDKISLGLRFSLVANLHYYLSKELNWLNERYTATHTRPQVLETGLDWYGRIFKSPFYGNFRLLYRDEEDTLSALSFLSGEDYLEGYSEITYRPSPDREFYISGRLRNVWQDNPNVRKRMEADLRAGLRYLWDTKIKWESVGEIEGFCFKDMNSDGIMQSDEVGLEGIKFWLGKDRFCITDSEGYYRFKKVKARKAYVNIDASSIPSGFILTVPVTQQASIIHGKKVRLDFGIIYRSEISGFIFEDKDEDGKFGPSDLGIGDVVLMLEDGSRAITDKRGQYFFRGVTPGRHTLTLDINTLPLIYLPSVPIFKDIELIEGAGYNYNIPLKRTQS